MERDQDDDVALLRATAAGDREAFTVLHGRHRSAIVRFLAARTGDATLAEDLAQETFLRVLRHAGDFEGRSRVSTWMSQIAVNLARDAMRHRDTRARRAEQGDPEIAREVMARRDAPEQPMNRIEADEEAGRLHDALARLPDEQREAVTLKHLRRMTCEEAADAMDIPVGTLKSRVRLGMVKLADLLGADTPTP